MTPWPAIPLCKCGCPAMTNSPFCGCCWMQRERKWDESRGEYREDETLPFSDPVSDSDYAGIEMYRAIML